MASLLVSNALFERFNKLSLSRNLVEIRGADALELEPFKSEPVPFPARLLDPRFLFESNKFEDFEL
jgi:hypothetical protein